MKLIMKLDEYFNYCNNTKGSYIYKMLDVEINNDGVGNIGENVPLDYIGYTVTNDKVYIDYNGNFIHTPSVGKEIKLYVNIFCKNAITLGEFDINKFKKDFPKFDGKIVCEV